MTRYPASPTPLWLDHQWSLLLRGVGCFSAIALLNGGMVWAQTSSPTASADELVPTESGVPLMEVAPADSAPAPTYLPTDPTFGTPAASENFIDSTSYSLGATERQTEPVTPPTWIPPVATEASPSLPPAFAGGGSESYRGVGAGMTTASSRYYFRTTRPAGRLGNGNIRLIFPLSIPAVITSAFGWRVHPISGELRFHAGTDIGAPLGTPVLAAYAGQVAIADFLDGYGLTVAMRHNQNTQETLYAHLSEIFVKPGDWLEQGAVIGRVGSTGNSTGPHLHFEFRQFNGNDWVAMDAGAQLEYSLAELVKALNTAQAQPVNRDREAG